MDIATMWPVKNW